MASVEQQLQEAQSELKALRAAAVEHAVVVITDATGRITFVNDKFCTISKYSREELQGKDLRIVNSGHHPKEFFRDLWATITAGKVWRGEVRNKSKSSSSFWLDLTTSPQLDQAGKPSQYIAIGTDITEYATLRKTSAAFETVMSTATDYIFFKDRNSRFVRASHALIRHLGASRLEEIRGKTDLDFFSEEHAHAAAQDEKAIIRSGEPFLNKEEKETHTDGSITWALTSKMPWHDKEGRLIGVMGVSRDITALKLAQQDAAQWCARFNCLLETLPIGISWAQISDDGKRTVKLINDEYLRLSGLTREEAFQWDSFRLITHPDDMVRQDAFSFQVAKGKIDRYSMEKRYLRPDGEIAWALFCYRMRNAGDGSFEDIYSAIDITERKALEEKLRMSELLINASGELSKVGVWIVELPNHATHWTRQVYDILELPPDHEPELDRAIDLIVPEYREIFRQAFDACARDGTPFNLEMEMITGNGRRIWVRTIGQVGIGDGTTQCVFGAVQDISALKNTAPL